MGILMLLVPVFAIEDWPISNMALFVYNKEQAKRFSHKFGSEYRLLGAASDACIDGQTIQKSRALDVIAWSLHASVPLHAAQYEGDGRFGSPSFWAAPWFNL